MSTANPVYPLQVKLSHIKNPDLFDRGGYWDYPTESGREQWITCVSVSEASRICREFIDRNELGGGNWNGGEVKDGEGAVIGRIAYNGRLFIVPDGERNTPPHPLSPCTKSEQQLQAIAVIDDELHREDRDKNSMSEDVKEALHVLPRGDREYYIAALRGIKAGNRMDLVEFEFYPAVERKVGPESEWHTEGLYSMPDEEEMEQGEGIEYFWSASIRCAPTNGLAQVFANGKTKMDVVGAAEGVFGDEIVPLLSEHSRRSKEQVSFLHLAEGVEQELKRLFSESENEGVKV